VHERGLHVDRQQDAEPDQVDAQRLRHRTEQRHDDERQFEEVEEEGQQEDENVDHDQEADLAPGESGKQMFDPEMAIDAVEGQEKTRAPTRMKTTKVVSLAVVSIACLSSLIDSRRGPAP
jgi:hypothetical protein